MKLAPVLFIASVAANVAAFALCLLRPALAPPGLSGFLLARRDSPSTSAATPVNPSRHGSAHGDAPTEKIWAALESDDLRTLVARLRAAGFSLSLIRAIVTAKVEERFNTQVRPLVARVADAPFWKPGPNDYNFGDAAFRESLNQAYRERSRLLRELLGDDIFVQGGGDPTVLQHRRFGDLPPAKIDLLQRITDDYNEMASQVRNIAQGITLPEDREKLALLEREKRADLAAVLSSAEFADYELRTSPVTSQLSNALTAMDANEAEFRAIYDAYRKHTVVLHPLGGGPTIVTPEIRQQRDAAHRQIADELKTAIGEQRHAEFARASTREFQDLVQFAARENLPRENVVRAFDLREHVARESNRILDDTGLNVEQKRAAFQLLVQNTKSQLNATLGPAVATAYVQSAAHWLSTVERGRAITFAPDGNWTSARSLPPRN